MSDPDSALLTVITAPVDGWCAPDGSACHLPGVAYATPTDDPTVATPDAPTPATATT